MCCSASEQDSRNPGGRWGTPGGGSELFLGPSGRPIGWSHGPEPGGGQEPRRLPGQGGAGRGVQVARGVQVGHWRGARNGQGALSPIRCPGCFFLGLYFLCLLLLTDFISVTSVETSCKLSGEHVRDTSPVHGTVRPPRKAQPPSATACGTLHPLQPPLPRPRPAIRVHELILHLV